jgi:hypothetical protein
MVKDRNGMTPRLEVQVSPSSNSPHLPWGRRVDSARGVCGDKLIIFIMPLQNATIIDPKSVLYHQQKKHRSLKTARCAIGNLTEKRCHCAVGALGTEEINQITFRAQLV